MTETHLPCARFATLTATRLNFRFASIFASFATEQFQTIMLVVTLALLALAAGARAQWETTFARAMLPHLAQAPPCSMAQYGAIGKLRFVVLMRQKKLEKKKKKKKKKIRFLCLMVDVALSGSHSHASLSLSFFPANAIFHIYKQIPLSHSIVDPTAVELRFNRREFHLG